jgi:23S rRNA (adenine2503-C2)-methyltransferase
VNAKPNKAGREKREPPPTTPRSRDESGRGVKAKPALLSVYRPDISEFLNAAGAPSYRHDQVYEHLLRNPLQPFSRATALPADTRQALDDLGVSSLAPAGVRTSPDGTTKLLLRGRDSSCVETVVMPYRTRITACISSQVGCPVGCAFCATGAMGFHRNLSAAEIVDQVRAASAIAGEERRRISNLVYMGMGEPMLNLQAVLDSIRILSDPRGMDLAHRAISISTVGIPGGMLRLARSEPQVNLALSLHASDDRTRALLIPKGFLHPLDKILDAAWEHFAITRRKLLVEYVLLSGVNDSINDAKRLAALLRGHVVVVNLLSWNFVRGLGQRRSSAATLSLRPEAQPSQFRPSPRAAISAFRDALLGAGVETVIRQSKGADIQAACGQLAGQNSAHDNAHSLPVRQAVGGDADVGDGE